MSPEMQPVKNSNQFYKEEIVSANPSSAMLEKTLIDMAIEGWRFAKLFARMMSKLDAGEATRYMSQLRYYIEKLESSLEEAGMRMVNLEGQLYDPGMAVTTLNSADFGPDDQLMIDQMLEPIIMGNEGLLRSGKILLRKAEQ